MLGDRRLTFAGLNALVIGQGSIGQRHARILREEGARVSIVSAAAPDAYRSVEDALRSNTFQYAVVANETSRHAGAVAELAGFGFRDRLLVEKPLSDLPLPLDLFSAFARPAVAYNLRFHPVIDALRTELSSHSVVEARLHVGQYLPDWRPGTDFRQGASARKSAGGGVLRDLSHELDLVSYLFGEWRALVALGGNKGVLDIETDEAWSIILEMASGAMVNLTLNYFDRPARRSISVTARDTSIHADIIGSALATGGEVRQFAVDRDVTYRAQHMAMLDDRDDRPCSIAGGEEVVKMIESIEQSAQQRQWVYR